MRDDSTGLIVTANYHITQTNVSMIFVIGDTIANPNKQAHAGIRESE
jgi:thioredoxin reductase